jgi:hypothetical protein
MKLHTSSTLEDSSKDVMHVANISAESVQPPEDVTQMRHQIIEEAAYWRASERAFAPGGELDDWLAAEANFNSNSAQNGNILE